MSKFRLLAADAKKKLFDIGELEPCGMRGGAFSPIPEKDFIKLPHGSEQFVLPGRKAVGFDRRNSSFPQLEDLYAVSAFISPGYTVTYNPAYSETEDAPFLPLFSYGAVGLHKGDIYVAAVRVDRELRQDLRFMDMKKAGRRALDLRRRFPKNRLVRHLENCAFINSCPAAKNFFLVRYEGPLPVSPSCNARCLGCISYQEEGDCPITQPRIDFVPTPEELAEAALYHIENVKDPVVSFGQGCEGEPLMEWQVMEKAIRLIRRNTSKGMINLNTNASLPVAIAALFDAGLDSIRVSLNSVRKRYYNLYYRPAYGFKDVMKSIRNAKKRGGFVSINYLTMPGFTDSNAEVEGLRRFLNKCRIDMIQWRNLNYDPLAYFRAMKYCPDRRELIGIRDEIRALKMEFPRLMHGYFNPSKGRIRRNKKG